MARKKQEGNRFFRMDADFFSDRKIKILKARYGADGIVLYLYLLCEIYKTGYYLQVDDDFEYIISDDLNMDGNKVKQVLNFLLERSLFDDTLFQSDKVLTSAGIQRRYQAMVKARATKTPITAERFWLLSEEETETFIKVNPSLNSSEKKSGFSEKKEDNSEKNNTKGKEKKKEYIDIDTAPPDITFDDPELERAFQGYLSSQEKNGRELSDYQVRLLRKKLGSLSDDMAEQLMIVEEATVQGWKSFYPVKKQPTKKKEKKTAKNTFNAFPQRDYDFDALERTLNK